MNRRDSPRLPRRAAARVPVIALVPVLALVLVLVLVGVTFVVEAPAASGAQPARVTSGLAFAMTLTDGGRSISGQSFSLRIPDTQGAVRIHLEGFELSGGTFTAPLRVKNDTDADLYGVRADLVSAAESSGPIAGGSVPSRELPAVAAPLGWDVLPKGTESDSLPFRAGGVAFGPSTSMVSLLAVLSGVANVARFTVEGASMAVSIETDASGNVILRDETGKAIRTSPEGRGAAEMRVPPPPRRDSGGPCVAERAAGRVCETAPDHAVWIAEGDSGNITIRDAAGALVRSLSLKEGAALGLAFGKNGRAYVLRRGGTITVLRSF